MKLSITLVVSLILASTAALHADPAKLEPSAELTLEFPDLPATYYEQKTGKKTVPLLSAQLPENYAADQAFPLFVFIEGGNGGAGSNASFARRIIGARDFIAVNLPLFNNAEAKPPTLRGVSAKRGSMINSNDAAVLSSSYRVMLEKLARTIPNIATVRSTLGGFSNGAHATSVLAAAKDDYILGHFTAFFLLEGGVGFALNPSALRAPALRGHRFIVLFGDTDKDPKQQIQRTLVAGPIIQLICQQAHAAGLDLTHIVMRGHGHEQPAEYLKVIGAWTRGE